MNMPSSQNGVQLFKKDFRAFEKNLSTVSQVVGSKRLIKTKSKFPCIHGAGRAVGNSVEPQKCKFET